MKRDRRRLFLAVLIAAILWFIMFSPWTKGWFNFWLEMSCAALLLTGLALSFSTDLERLRPIEKPLWQLLGGIALAFVLWGIFWVGDKASSWLFDFARPEVDAVYAMKTGLPSWSIALLLLFLIGPAEEFFWRGYVQHTLERICNGPRAKHWAFALTLCIYAFIHVWSGNLMLLAAAAVAGFVWGIIYWFCPKALPALILSHALWDALVFVLLPI